MLSKQRGLLKSAHKITKTRIQFFKELYIPWAPILILADNNMALDISWGVGKSSRRNTNSGAVHVKTTDVEWNASPSHNATLLSAGQMMENEFGLIV